MGIVYLEHVAENAKHAVESSVIRRTTFGAVSLPLNTSHHLGDENEIDDQWRGQQGVLADIEETDGLVTVQEDLGVVLVKGALVVSHSRHVLDDDTVVGMLAFLVQDVVGGDHVIDNIGLGDLFGSELLLGAEVHAIVVAEMVVAGNGSELNTGVDHKVDKSRLHLGLARFEVITANEGVVLLGQLDGTRDESVLGRAVDEGDIFKDRSNGEDGRGRNLFVTCLDCLEKVVSGVVYTLDEFSEALGVGSPLDNDLVETVGSLEFAASCVRDSSVLDKS
jgi:hypothetical protein